MNLSEVIKLARERGYKVSYSSTMEGGWKRIRVKSVTGPDGKRMVFSRSKGNTYLRSAVGQEESAKATASRRASAEAQRGKESTRGLAKLSKRESNRIRSINRKLKKLGKTARLSARTYRQRKTREGSEGIRQTMENTLMHYQGWAYPENVFFHAANFKRDGLSTLSENLMSLIRKNKKGRWVYRGDAKIQDDFLKRIVDEVYNVMNEAKMVSDKERAGFLAKEDERLTEKLLAEITPF